MELIITILCLLVFIFGILLIDLRIRVNQVIRKVEILIGLFKLQEKMETIEKRLNNLGGGAPNPPTEPKPDPDPEND